MAEKLTMKSLSVELDELRKKVSQLERQMNRKIETAVKKTLDDAIKQVASERGKERYGAGVDAAERQRLIAEAAYLMAERRGFEAGDPAQDWINAEEEVNRKLLHGESS
jgi:predicted transcriptional regulator